MADLVRQERSALERAIGGVAYELRDERKDACAVVTSQFTVSFVWMWRERWIDADVEVHDVSAFPYYVYAKCSARDWLEARGLPTLPRRSGKMSLDLLRDELASLAGAVANIISDPTALRKALFYRAGLSQGYNDRVVSPETAPPANIPLWAEARFRRLPDWD
jgi:hypothetical protein